MSRRAYMALAGVALGAALLVAAARPARASSLVSTDDEDGGDDATDAARAAYYELESTLLGDGMKLSREGRDALARREAFSPVPYRDEAGILTIGYGHVIKEGESYSAISPAQGADLLAVDVAEAENAVNALVSVVLTQSQFDALVSFVFNVGAGAFRRSTLLRRLNAGEYWGVSEELAKWDKVTRGGVKVASNGLATRRAGEAAQFNA